MSADVIRFWGQPLAFLPFFLFHSPEGGGALLISWHRDWELKNQNWERPSWLFLEILFFADDVFKHRQKHTSKARQVFLLYFSSLSPHFHGTSSQLVLRR